jgi:hypothetical protein
MLKEKTTTRLPYNTIREEEKTVPFDNDNHMKIYMVSAI